MTNSSDELVERVVSVVSRVAGPERTPAEIDEETRLSEAGFCLTSMEMVDMVMALEEEFRVEWDAEGDLTPETLASIGALVAVLRTLGADHAPPAEDRPRGG